ncbi:MAG: hypothetical protein KY428_00770 [Bacteroidetes bacterium]|nr:hypothetical protein [Bacteroidota bacterium]
MACEEATEAQQIIDQAMVAHGSAQLQQKELSFDFREKHYTYTRRDHDYLYTRSFTDSTGQVQDFLSNEGFYRLVDGDTARLSQERIKAFSNSINSVIYFALLPYGLNDAAVNKTYLGQTKLAGKDYHRIGITFDEEGGGEDFEDEFLYWINTETYTLDYLAYSYQTEGGGLRFRKAINPSVIGGIRFQDYINYKPKIKDIPLDSLEALFGRGELEVLSHIELENIEVDAIK